MSRRLNLSGICYIIPLYPSNTILKIPFLICRVTSEAGIWCLSLSIYIWVVVRLIKYMNGIKISKYSWKIVFKMSQNTFTCHPVLKLKASEWERLLHYSIHCSKQKWKNNTCGWSRKSITLSWNGYSRGKNPLSFSIKFTFHWRRK